MLLVGPGVSRIAYGLEQQGIVAKLVASQADGKPSVKAQDLSRDFRRGRVLYLYIRSGGCWGPEESLPWLRMAQAHKVACLLELPERAVAGLFSRSAPPWAAAHTQAAQGNYCQYGSRVRRHTRFVAFGHGPDSLGRLCRKCRGSVSTCHNGKSHSRDRRSIGEPPRGLARQVASVIISSLRSRFWGVQISEDPPPTRCRSNSG